MLGPDEVQSPNGLMLSLDDRILYVIETNQAADGHRRISAFDLSADGRVGNGRVFHDFYPGRSGFGGPDLKTLYVTAGNTIFKAQVQIPGTRR